MILNFITMNGYGIFVWLAFGITAAACLTMYFQTKKTLKKYESEFAAELEKLSNEEKQAVIEKSKIATQVLASQNKTA
jgi:heme exporter protein CcmD